MFGTISPKVFVAFAPPLLSSGLYPRVLIVSSILFLVSCFTYPLLFIALETVVIEVLDSLATSFILIIILLYETIFIKHSVRRPAIQLCYVYFNMKTFSYLDKI